MRYSIVDAKKGEDYGFLPVLHQTTANGTKMVLNENELLHIDSDIDNAASLLGGVVMSEAEVLNIINQKVNE